MATYFFSSNPTISNFILTGNPNPDTFIVDTGIASSRLRIFQSGNNVLITDGANTATIQNFAVAQITSGQFTNNDGSQIRVGDNTVGVAGDAGPNVINLGGTTGGNFIIGQGGNDDLDGGSGNDFILGQTGDDTIITPGGNANEGNDTVQGGQGDDNINYGGSAGRFLISGNLGNDVVRGGINADTLFGGQGNDTMSTSDGDGDIMNGGLGLDQITGGTGNDTLLGGDGQDTLRGAGGSNLVSGQLDDDIIIGGAGSNDTVFGGQGQDIINYSALAAGQKSLIFANFGNDSVLGGSGSDSINGGQGNDTIVGGLGNDSMAGGLGNDVFEERTNSGAPATTMSGTTTATADTIVGFVTGQDKILSFNEGSASPTSGTAANYREYQDATITTVEQAVSSYNFQTNSLYTFIAGATDGFLVIDSNVGGAADAVIKLTGVNSLNGFDFTDIQ